MHLIILSSFSMITKNLQLFLNDNDGKGIFAHGTCREDALDDFRMAVEDRVQEKLGGIYLGTSNHNFQDQYFRDLEYDCDDGVKVIDKWHVNVTIFTDPILSYHIKWISSCN
jgi:hypothetical protein